MKKIFVCLVVLGLLAVPALHARSTSLSAGLTMTKSCQHHSHTPRATAYQKALMRDILNNYHPAYHDTYVNYVVFELRGHLTQGQQRYLLRQLNEQACYSAPPCPRPPRPYVHPCHPRSSIWFSWGVSTRIR